jgi:hypothetical protein
MAGNQASAMSKPTFTRYEVKPHNKPPSSVYFNQVKKYIIERYPTMYATCKERYGEKEWWEIVYKEMTEYTFDFEDNQARFLYAKYIKEFK